MTNAKDSIKKNDVVIAFVPQSGYTKTVMDMSKDLASLFGNTCYISLNRSYDVIRKDMEKSGIDPEKFTFIDCVGKAPDTGKLLHVSSPKALTELSITTNKTISNGKIECALFDSISTIIIYEEPSMVTKFAHSLISSFRSKGVKVLFTCQGSDAETPVIKDLSMFVDSTVNL